MYIVILYIAKVKGKGYLWLKRNVGNMLNKNNKILYFRCLLVTRHGTIYGMTCSTKSRTMCDTSYVTTCHARQHDTT